MAQAKRMLPMAAILVLALIVTGTVVSARPQAQEDVSEDLDYLLAEPLPSPRVNNMIGDDADEDGYTGQIDTAEQPAEPSEPGQIQTATPVELAAQPDDNGYGGPVDRSVEIEATPSETQTDVVPDWDQFFTEPQADQDSFAAPQGMDPNAPEAWSDFYYVYVAGAALRPRDSSSGWDYRGVGCVARASGSELLNIHLDVPNGSRIDYLRLYYYDTSSNNSSAWITNYDSAGNFTDLTSVQSAGSGGYGTQLSPYVGHVVNNATRSYVLNWSASQNGSSMLLCGMRVAYRLPV